MRRQRAILTTAVVVLLAVVAFVTSSLATDRPQFCPTCHEMGPYYDAWANGPHREKSCIDCHVEPGLPARFAHKFVALKEVVAHFAGDTSFPRAVPPTIPNDRCARCHRDLPTNATKGFSHADHVEKAQCAQCHFDTGHRVSNRALQAAGIFNPKVSPKRFIAENAVVDGGKDNLAGHPAVACSNCHDMRATPCSSCHQHPGQGHPDIGTRDCSACHRPASQFVFNHPNAGEHDWRKKPCVKCHPVSYDKVYCTCHKGKPPRD